MITHRIPIRICLENFEGPLDLLLHLIQSRALDISKISIGKITTQYLNYIYWIQELNFDLASEFLIMAATLLHWKSRHLLPVEEVEESLDPEEFPSQDALVLQLLEHQQFQQAGQQLAQLPYLGIDVFQRTNPQPDAQKIWRIMNSTALVISYQQILIRSRQRTHVLQKETVSIEDKIHQLLRYLTTQTRVLFTSLILKTNIRPEIVATFLATLELARLHQLKIYQTSPYAPIYLEAIPSSEALQYNLELSFQQTRLESLS